jgi:hypothetical protein
VKDANSKSNYATEKYWSKFERHYFNRAQIESHGKGFSTAEEKEEADG